MGATAQQALTVAVLSGGRSAEHDISLASGAAVAEGLAQAGHDVLEVRIDRDGTWTAQGRQLRVTPGAGLLGADVAFPVLHGPFGEDGTVQGMLEVLGVPYVGSGVGASALCIDKVLFKRFMAALGMPQVRFAGVHAERFAETPGAVVEELLAELGLPVFVKPAHLGSSLGMDRVSEPAGLEAALERAFAYDASVIVEEFSPGIEVECGVLGCLRSEREAGSPAAEASPPGEIVLPGEWYDFDAKYRPGGMSLRVPAQIGPEEQRSVRELALAVFAGAGCDGLARVDFFVEQGRVLVNELNTMPGFTPTSVYARLIAERGIAYPELMDRLCRLACERDAARRALSAAA